MRRRTWLGGALAIGTLLAARGGHAGAVTAYDFTLKGIDGAPLPLRAYAGKALLVVNTASMCGFTGQYAGLQSAWERWRDRGLVVIGVPSDDFNQELESDAAVKTFCTTEFGIDFPLAAKTHVKGEGADPLFRFFVDRLGKPAEPRWNFHKILVDAQGAPVKAFPTRVEPGDAEVVAAIEAALPGSGVGAS